MTGYAGAMKALHDSGILDCATYVGGLSGSSWYVKKLALYSLILCGCWFDVRCSFLTSL